MQGAKMRFAERRPVGFATLLWVGLVVGYLVAGTVAHMLELGSMALGLIATGMLSVVGLLILTRMGWWREVGFGSTAGGRMLLWFALPALIATRALWSGVKGVDVGALPIVLLSALLVGFVEELFFRGLILRALLPTGTGRAVFVSVLLFSLTHMLNVLGGRDPLATVVQIGYAAALGFMYAALWVRTRAILPLMLVHAATDLFVWLAEGGVGVEEAVSGRVLVVPAILAVVAVAYGVMVLRSPQPQQGRLTTQGA